MVAFLVNVACGWNKCFIFMKLTLFYVAFKCYNCCTFQLVKIVCIYCATRCIFCATRFINVATFVAYFWNTLHFFVYAFHFECNVLHFPCNKKTHATKSQRMQQKVSTHATRAFTQNTQQCHSKYATISKYATMSLKICNNVSKYATFTATL